MTTETVTTQEVRLESLGHPRALLVELPGDGEVIDAYAKSTGAVALVVKARRSAAQKAQVVYLPEDGGAVMPEMRFFRTVYDNTT